MPRFQSSKKPSSFFGLLIVALLCLVGIVVYNVVSNGGFSFDTRSRAAEEVKTVKVWDFTTNGQSDGWNGINIVSSQVRGGNLIGTVGNQRTLPAYTNANPGFGGREFGRYAFTDNSIKVRLAVTPAQGCARSYTSNGPSPRPSQKPCPTTAPFVFAFELVVRGRNEQNNSPTSITGTADGQMREYEFTLPKGMPLSSITSLSLRFTGLSGKVGTQISIDSITVLSRQSVQPTTTPIIRSEVTKTGTLERDRLEGTSGYTLKVESENKTYRLIALQMESISNVARLDGTGSANARDSWTWSSEGSNRPTENRQGDNRREEAPGQYMRDLFESFVGMKVIIKGYVVVEKTTSWFGIPRGSQSIIQVTSIEKAL